MSTPYGYMPGYMSNPSYGAGHGAYPDLLTGERVPAALRPIRRSAAPRLNCPLFHLYTQRAAELVARARRTQNYTRARALAGAARKTRDMAQIELAKCRSGAHRGYAGHDEGHYGIHPRPRRARVRLHTPDVRRMGMSEAGYAGWNPNYGASIPGVPLVAQHYGGCGHCGTPACPDGQYGAGCGTFLRIRVRDPAKKQCLLEKDIARLEAKCAKGKTKKCEKLERKQAELAALLGMAEGPADLQTAEDMALASWQAQGVQADADLSEAKAKGRQTLTYMALGGMGLLIAVAALRRK